MLNALSSLAQGDYTPYWATIGLEEDHPLIDLLLTLFGY